jgi:hypothetical protein
VSTPTLSGRSSALLKRIAAQRFKVTITMAEGRWAASVREGPWVFCVQADSEDELMSKLASECGIEPGKVDR